MKYLTLSVLLCVSCAQTVLYNREGGRVAVFQGNMTGSEFTMSADGSVSWRVANVNHADATRAQGEAAANKVNAIGTGLVTVGSILLTHHY